MESLSTLKSDDTVRAEVSLAVQRYPAEATAFVVKDVESFTVGSALLKGIRAMRLVWKDHMNPHIDGALEAKRVAEANRKRLVTDFESRDIPLATAERTLAGKLGDFEQAAEKARLAAQQRLQAEQDARAEEEALATAIALEEAAKTAVGPVADVLMEQAEQVLDTPMQATVTIERATPKIGGFSQPVTWGAEITSLKDLLTALIAGKLDKVLTPEMEKRIKEAVLPPLNIRARALKSALNIPGVKAVSNKGYRLG